MKSYIYIYLFTFINYLTLSGSFAQETPISLATSTGEIKGTLTMPAKKNGIPLVLMISGSGPTDRNCNSAYGLKSDAFKYLAESFRKKGIASVRFDKRGVGESQPMGFNREELRFDNYVEDVKGWIEMLSKDKRFSKIIIAGHSEGSLIGILASANNSNVKGFISISGPGQNACSKLKEQFASLPSEMMESAYSKLDSLKNSEMVANNIEGLEMIFHPILQPYLISWFQYDPVSEIKKLNIPVAIIQGTTDIQVSEGDAELLANAYPSAEKMIIKNMNHPLKDCDTKDQAINSSTYNKPELPLNKEFVKKIIGFVLSIK